MSEILKFESLLFIEILELLRNCSLCLVILRRLKKSDLIARLYCFSNLTEIHRKLIKEIMYL